MNSLISLLIVLAVAGFIVWILVTYVPMPPVFKRVLIGIAAIALVVYALRALAPSLKLP